MGTYYYQMARSEYPLHLAFKQDEADELEALRADSGYKSVREMVSAWKNEKLGRDIQEPKKTVAQIIGKASASGGTASSSGLRINEEKVRLARFELATVEKHSYANTPYSAAALEIYGHSPLYKDYSEEGIE